MKKIIVGIGCSVMFLSAATIQPQNLNLITESLVYLIKDVQTLKKENMLLKQEIKKLQKQIESFGKEKNISSSVNNLNKTKKYKKENNNYDVQKRKNKNNSLYIGLYRVISDELPAYELNNLTGEAKRIYRKNDILKVIKENNKTSQLENKYWIDAKKLEKLKSKKGVLYQVATYMANVRISPNASNKSDIVRVLRKNDIVEVVGVVKNIDGGIWAKLSNGLYVNKKILVKLENK